MNDLAKNLAQTIYRLTKRLETFESNVIREIKTNKIINCDERMFETDGLIFTPRNYSYVIGNWSFALNKLFKWKPSNELTVDVVISDKVSGSSNKYYTTLGSNKLTFREKDIIVTSQKELFKGSVVECLPSKISLNDNSNELICTYVLNRKFKKTGNKMKTIEGIMQSLSYGPDELLKVSYL